MTRFGIPALATIGTVASDLPEFTGPITNSTLSRKTSCWARFTALVGSPAVSRVISSSCRPSTPPFALISWTANFTPSFSAIAAEESGPVNEESQPILMLSAAPAGCPVSRATPAAAIMPVKARRRRLMVSSLIVRRCPVVTRTILGTGRQLVKAGVPCFGTLKAGLPGSGRPKQGRSFRPARTNWEAIGWAWTACASARARPGGAIGSSPRRSTPRRATSTISASRPWPRPPSRPPRCASGAIPLSPATTPISTTACARCCPAACGAARGSSATRAGSTREVRPCAWPSSCASSATRG